MEAFNAPLSSVRISVGWLFGDVINLFKFFDFNKNLKISMSSIGKMCIVCALLHYSPPLPHTHLLGILCLELERNRTLYKSISNFA